jgi:hypothetical protein
MEPIFVFISVFRVKILLLSAPTIQDRSTVWDTKCKILQHGSALMISEVMKQFRTTAAYFTGKLAHTQTTNAQNPIQ